MNDYYLSILGVQPWSLRDIKITTPLYCFPLADLTQFVGVLLLDGEEEHPHHDPKVSLFIQAMLQAVGLVLKEEGKLLVQGGDIPFTQVQIVIAMGDRAGHFMTEQLQHVPHQVRASHPRHYLAAPLDKEQIWRQGLCHLTRKIAKPVMLLDAAREIK